MDLKLSILFETVDKLSAPFRSMRTATDGLRDTIKTTAATLKELDQAAGKLEAYRQFRLVDIGNNTVKLREAQTALEAAVTAGDAGEKKLAKLRDTVDKLGDKQTTLALKARQMREELQKAGINTDDLAAAKADLTTKMDAATAAAAREAAALKKLDAQTHALHKTNVARDQMMRRAATLSFAGQAGMAAGRGVLDRLGTTLDPLRSVEKVKGELASLGVTDLEAVIRAGEQVQGRFAGLTTDAFVAAAYDIKSGVSSLSDEGVAAMTAAAATTAKATKAEVGQMTSLFATSYGIFKSQFKEMGDGDFGNMFGSSLAAAVQAFKTDGGKMQQALESAGAIATTMGMSMHEEMAVLGMLQQKMAAGEAGTALRALATNASKAHGELRKYGVAVLDTTGKMRPMQEVMGDMMKKFGGADGKLTAKGMDIIKKAFGTDEAMKVLTGLQDNYQAINANADILKAAAANGLDYADAMAKVMDTNLDSRIKVLNQRLDLFRGTIGKALLPILDRLLPKLDGLLTWVEAFAAENPGLVGGLVTAAAAIGGLLSVGGGLLSLLAGILGPLAMVKWAVVTLGIKFGFLNAAMWANPIGVVIAACVALAAAIYIIYANWDGIVGWFTAKLDAVFAAFDQGFLQGLCALFMEFNPFMILMEAANGLINYLFGIDIKGWLLEQINGLTNAMPDWFKDMVGIATPTMPPSPEVINTAATKSANLQDTRADIATAATMGAPRVEDNSNHETKITVITQPGQDPQAVGQAVYDKFNGATTKPRTGSLLFDPA